MPTYIYETTKMGKRREGFLNSVSIEIAGQKLKDSGAIILRLEESSSSKRTKFIRSPMEVVLTKLCIGTIAIEQAFEQLGILLKEGVPILSALELMQKTSPFLLARVFRSISYQIKEGLSISESIRIEAGFLGNINISLITIGETNGSLPEMLVYAADLMQQKRAILNKIIEAMLYPLIVIVMTCGAAYFLVSHVLPKVLGFISQRSGKPPAMTRALITISEFIRNYGFMILCSLGIIIVLIVIARRIDKVRYIIDWLLLRVPLIGKAIVSYSNSLWCRTLGLLIESGINITTALELTENTMHNFVFKKQFKLIQNKLTQGNTISESFRSTSLHYYAPVAGRMLLVGESSGSIDRCLINAANYNANILSRRVAFIGKFIEPAMFIIVGGMVGFVYIAFIMAIMAATRSV